MKRVVLITGAQRGLGACLTDKFLNEGYQVFATVNKPIGDELKQKESKHDGLLLYIQMDVRDLKDIQSAKNLIHKQVDSIDLIINNAGVLGDIETTIQDSLDYADIENLFSINTLGPLKVINTFLDLLKKGQESTLLNISSDAASLNMCGDNNWFGYNMSKVALNMQSVILNNVLQADGIQVIAMHPGWMRTHIRGHLDTLAPLEPMDAAISIFNTLKDLRGKKLDHIYMDNLGNPLPW